MLEWTDTFKHFGNAISADQKYDSDIQLKRSHFYTYANYLSCKFRGTLMNSDMITSDMITSFPKWLLFFLW